MRKYKQDPKWQRIASLVNRTAGSEEDENGNWVRDPESPDAPAGSPQSMTLDFGPHEIDIEVEFDVDGGDIAHPGQASIDLTKITLLAARLDGAPVIGPELEALRSVVLENFETEGSNLNAAIMNYLDQNL